MKNLILVVIALPCITLLISVLIAGAVCIAPFFLVGFLIWNRQKNKRKNDIIKLIKNKARAFEA